MGKSLLETASVPHRSVTARTLPPLSNGASYSASIEQHDGFLHVRVTGRNSAESVRGYLAEIRAACTRTGCGKVLVEEHLEGPGLGMGEIFEIVSSGTKQVSPAVRAVAFIDTNSEHEAKMMSFAEDVAVTRGMNMRVFSSVADAQAWLKSVPD